MSSYENEKPWKQKAKRTILIVVAIAIGVSLLILAGTANDKAKKNMAKINVPEYEIQFVPGGPERFTEIYNEIEFEEDEKEPEIGSYIWSTVILKNTGYSEGEDVDVELNTSVPTDHTIVTSSAYYSDTEISTDEEDKTNKLVEVESMDTEDTLYIFLAFDPKIVDASSAEAVKKWKDNYKNFLEQIKVESEEDSAIYYGNAIKNIS